MYSSLPYAYLQFKKRHLHLSVALIRSKDNKFWPLSTYVFNCAMKWEAPFLPIKLWLLFREKALRWFWVANWTGSFFMECHLYLKVRLTNYSCSGLDVGRHFLKMNTVSPLLQGKLIVHVGSGKIQSKNKTWKIYVCHHVLVSCVIHTFLMRSVVLLKNMIFWYCMMECVNIWKIYICSLALS